MNIDVRNSSVHIGSQKLQVTDVVKGVDGSLVD